MSEISDLAQRIVDDEFFYLTGSDLTIMFNRVSGWLMNNVGTLNTLIHQSFSGANPGMGLEEQAIYRYLYLGSYYNNKSAAVLKNMDSANLEWLSIKEGDSSITLQNKNEVAKSFKQLARESLDEAKAMVTAYNIYQASPRQVDVRYVTSTQLASDLEISASSDTETSSFGFYDIPSGQDFVFVPLSLSQDPTGMAISLIKPNENSSNLTYAVRGNISSTGFYADLGFAVQESGYKIGYVVK